ncbi:MAG: prepilin-type N-terminal cleavage/methylation domain-containing protein [Burkholderiaceae bacterium]
MNIVSHRLRTPAAPRPAQAGFTLLESLIAIVVFAIAVLGMIGAQASGAQVTSDARYRTEAAAAADELLARMQIASPATVVADFTTGGALFDLWLQDRVQADAVGLPAGDATVEFASVAGDPLTVRIVISWVPPRHRVRDGSGAISAMTDTRRHVTVSALYN